MELVTWRALGRPRLHMTVLTLSQSHEEFASTIAAFETFHASPRPVSRGDRSPDGMEVQRRMALAVELSPAARFNQTIRDMVPIVRQARQAALGVVDDDHSRKCASAVSQAGVERQGAWQRPSGGSTFSVAVHPSSRTEASSSAEPGAQPPGAIDTNVAPGRHPRAREGTVRQAVSALRPDASAGASDLAGQTSRT
mmetsp:Transcript_20900/g.61846  ORF Transcript_20900/g.61846 Transcript_20900/m.61846 type:complete len:196 (-) Transcript_20900:110-697(-)